MRVGVRDVPPRSSAPSTSLTAAEALVGVRMRVRVGVRVRVRVNLNPRVNPTV